MQPELGKDLSAYSFASRMASSSHSNAHLSNQESAIDCHHKNDRHLADTQLEQIDGAVHITAHPSSFWLCDMDLNINVAMI